MASAPEISVFKCVTGMQNVRQIKRQLGLTASKVNTNSRTAEKDKSKAGATAETKNESSFTKEQDGTIVKMKLENKTWNEIGQAIGKQKHEVQARFKEINPNKEGGETAAKDKSKDKENQNAGGKQQGNRKEGGKKDNSLKGLSDDNMKTLSRIVTNYHENRWLLVASEFFDEVGIRIDHEDVKEKFQ